MHSLSESLHKCILFSHHTRGSSGLFLILCSVVIHSGIMIEQNQVLGIEPNSVIYKIISTLHVILSLEPLDQLINSKVLNIRLTGQHQKNDQSSQLISEKQQQHIIPVQKHLEHLDKYIARRHTSKLQRADS